ncbi:MAG: 3'-5' exonuclease [Candidatus Bathyarchaeia archaeon]
MNNSKIQGWILDLYHKNGKMNIWVKSKSGLHQLTDEWIPSIYVSGEKSDLIELARLLNNSNILFEEKYLSPETHRKSEVLKIPVHTHNQALELAKYITLSSRKFSLFNVDIPPEQIYLYEKNIFPLAQIEANPNYNSIRWKIIDKSSDINYQIPELNCIDLDITTNSQNKISSFKDKLQKITIRNQEEAIIIDSNDEEENFLELVRLFKKIDPDVIYTHNGNSFLFPYIEKHAQKLGISNQIILGREQNPLKILRRKGRSYFSYGRIHYRPTSIRILGRIHIDTKHSYFHNDCGLEGIIEISRTCRIPLQKCVDSTIGTSMTSIQLYHAFRKDILAPWFKALPEDLKTAEELIIADRGGLYYSPRVGVHDDVGELDFSSLYPTLMCKFNLSGETVRCRCCPQSRNKVPELGYNICEKRRGIVPISLEELLEKRLRYKQMMKEARSPLLKENYRKRQAALKWILVCA